MDLQQQIKEVLGKYSFPGSLRKCSAFGNGHINDTFLVEYENGEKTGRYVLQRINQNVFRDPDGLMENMRLVTDFLKKQVICNGGDPMREVLTILPTSEGALGVRDSIGEYWRVTAFISDAFSPEETESPEVLYESGLAFGVFQRLLSGFDASLLTETIPNFHHTPKRLEAFLDAIEKDPLGRVAGVKEEIDFVLERSEDMKVCQKAYEEGRLPLRVSHNDTKLNNILFDNDSKKGICIIDLDTVMPGFSVFDYGDSIRFGASTAAEDEKDLSKVSLDLVCFEQFTRGFLEGGAGAFTAEEIRLMPMGAKNMTLEVGMRFLMDYILGDVYFKIAYLEHNLVRSRTQFVLVKDMEKKWKDMEKIVSKYS